MLRINQQSNASAAKSYYTSAAEYYGVGEQETIGQWGGEAAAMLGLPSEVFQPHFHRMCDNRHPLTGQQLTARMRAGRRVGYDFNFHVCKSFSLLHAMTGDPLLLESFLWAVRKTMREMEKGVRVRVRKGGRMDERTVGNLAWAEFIHFTARPVKGVIDPHVHAHCFVPNACFDRVEGMWKAIDVASIQANAPHWQARFRQLLGHRLADLGYNVVWQGKDFEIAGIARSTIDKFSGRTNHINHVADTRRITDPEAKDGLGAATRERKRKDATLPQLQAGWRARLTDEERAAIGQAALRQRHPAYPQTPPATPSSGQAMIARLRKRARAARPELDAWERERRDWIRQQPTRREAPSQARAR